MSNSPYVASPTRYDDMTYRRCGASGLHLPAISLGLWHNFGQNDCHRAIRERLLFAFDQGVTHFDLANEYGPPEGGAERSFGRVLQEDLRQHRDEIIVSTKAGWQAWPGPYGDWGSRKYMIASLDRSLKHLGCDYVDIYYHHRPDPETPIEETALALHHLVEQGKVLYVGISAYDLEQTKAATEVFRSLRTPYVVHQPRFNLLDQELRTSGLLANLAESKLGCAVFSPLAQGLLSDRYLDGVPSDSRAVKDPSSLNPLDITGHLRSVLCELQDVAREREQSLAQMAIAWILSHPEVTTVLCGASSVSQFEHNLAALRHLDFSSDELERINKSLARLPSLRDGERP